MGYERDRDQVLWNEEIQISDRFKPGSKYRFVLAVLSYGGGQPKLEVKRLAYGGYKKGEYGKLGRLSLYELEKLMPAMERAFEFMARWKN